MIRRAIISASLTVNPGVTIAFGDELEVSLDCLNCKRKRRTVIFTLGGGDGRCMPITRYRIRRAWIKQTLPSGDYESREPDSSPK